MMKVFSFVRQFTRLDKRDYLPKLTKDIHNRLDVPDHDPLIERVMAWGIHPDASAARAWLDKNEIRTLAQLERFKPVKPHADWRRRLWLWLLSLEGSYAYDPHAREWNELR